MMNLFGLLKIDRCLVIERFRAVQFTVRVQLEFVHGFSFAPLGLAFIPFSTHALRRGLHSCAALRLCLRCSLSSIYLPGSFKRVCLLR